MSRPDSTYNRNWGPDTGPDGPDNSRINQATRQETMGGDLPGEMQQVGQYKHSTWGTPIHNGEGLSDWDGYGRQT